MLTIVFDSLLWLVVLATTLSVVTGSVAHYGLPFVSELSPRSLLTDFVAGSYRLGVVHPLSSELRAALGKQGTGTN